MGLEEMRARAKKRAREDRSDLDPARPRLPAIFGADRELDSPKDSPEFRRVLGLPTRKPIDLIDFWTATLKRPEGSMRLRPIQAETLNELDGRRGVFGAIGVGEGKTLISALAPTVAYADRPLLIVPAKLREKTHRDFAELRKHWQMSEIRIISYEKLGRVSAAEYLDELKPDMVIADEAHRLKNPSAAVTRRVVRYLRMNPGVSFLAMSGTIASRSLMDFHHLLALTLGVDHMPLPAPRAECARWARVVDEKIDGPRSKPGALTGLVQSGPNSGAHFGLDAVREAVGKRIFSTPGIVHTPKGSVDASITVDFQHPELSPTVKEKLEDLESGLCPNGDEATPADVYRHARTLVLGFYYAWDPEPPWDWLDARRNWKRVVRDVLEMELPGLDSELQVAQAAEAGKLGVGGTWERWKGVRATFKPNSVPVWLDTSVLCSAAAWTKAQPKPTIIWVEHQAAGKQLEEITGYPFFHQQGLSDSGAYIDDAEGTIIASIGANAEGRNLQKWDRNFILTPPGSGRIMEQLFGRTHRTGQASDEVHFEILLGHSSIRDSVRQAFADAKFIAATTGQPQKLNLADVSSAL